MPWTGAYVTANGDLTVDHRSNMAAESRAKIVYEYLMKFTDDPLVHESLRFLMTREIAHFQMFGAALDSIEPNFPPGVLQGDPRYANKYFNMSSGASARGPWNQGTNLLGDEWQYVDDPLAHVIATQGMLKDEPRGTAKSEKEVSQLNKQLSETRSKEVKQGIPNGANQWSSYPQDQLESPKP